MKISTSLNENHILRITSRRHNNHFYLYFQMTPFNWQKSVRVLNKSTILPSESCVQCFLGLSRRRGKYYYANSLLHFTRLRHHSPLFLDKKCRKLNFYLSFGTLRLKSSFCPTRYNAIIGIHFLHFLEINRSARSTQSRITWLNRSTWRAPTVALAKF